MTLDLPSGAGAQDQPQSHSALLAPSQKNSVLITVSLH